MATAVLSVAVGAASMIAQNRQAKKAASAQAEQNSISNASGEINNVIARRRAAREARINQARLASSAANTGASGSSGLAGASSAISSNLGAAVAHQSSQEQAARGLSAASQRIADAQSKINSIRGWTKVANTAIGAVEDWQESQG